MTRINYLSKSDALDKMLHSKGRFFTATFSKKDGGTRTINCKTLKDQEIGLGYVKVTDSALVRAKASTAIRNVNMQTLTELKISGIVYKVR